MSRSAPHHDDVVVTGLCEWFALCDRAATTTRWHPVLGLVPICDECDQKIARLSSERAES